MLRVMSSAIFFFLLVGCCRLPAITHTSPSWRTGSGVSGRILEGSGCSLLRARKHFRVGSRCGRRPNPTPITLAVTLTLTLIPTRTQNGQKKTGQKRGRAASDLSFTIPNCGPRLSS
ncbi:unnamed protein product [Laminaria digitata]